MSAAVLDFPVRIALLDDHALFRQGLRYLLRTLPYVGEVFDTGSLPELLAYCRRQVPDVLLLDLQMPDVEGAEAAQQLLGEFANLKIIVLSMFSADGYITQMLQLGARSYLPKDVDQQVLRQAIEDVVLTGQHVTAAMARARQRGLPPPPAPARATPPHLTRRELEVLHLLCEGHTTAGIAAQLCISPRTAEGHRQRLLEKTGVSNSVSLVRYAVQHHLLGKSLLDNL